MRVKGLSVLSVFVVILFTYNVSDRKLFSKSSRLDLQRSILSESVHSVKCFQATVYGGAGGPRHLRC